MPDYGLGRIPSPADPRDQNFTVISALLSEPLPPYKYWTSGVVLNQLNTPHCVGFSFAQWEMTSPVRRPRTFEGNTRGHDIYRLCKEIDGYNGDGTWIRVGAKIMQREGRIANYLWAYDVETIRRWVLTKGPIIVGTSWYDSMFDPPTGEPMRVGGANVGGHAYTVVGYSSTLSAFRILNSWGRNWGQEGRAWISSADFGRLLSEDGEALAAVEKAV